ncbi:hypothetical protein QD172_04785 [Cobetia sp. 10Alg 146]|uniref:hypothetical protein n=1 Tax=Cobetia sp. 10Alg 146 TaxID=3040019 RepID=UPI002447F777|nr:hypothetical protein [Cobetia sp. 10Alg 146]MDH2290574.1 hypothetical protein [Cobetia sp. 10Alg 146]
MEIKFKVRVSQFICLLGSVLLLLEAARQISLALTITGLLLAIGGTLLLVVSLAHELFTLGWFRTTAMLSVAVIMALLVLLAPEQHMMWLWGFAVLLLYPRPAWLAPACAIIGLITTWLALTPLGSDWLSLGIGITATLMALGAIAGQRQQEVWRQLERRGRRDANRAIWSQYQLLRDLPREISRADREDIHIELILLEPATPTRLTRRRLLNTLDSAALPHETRYQLDDGCLALLLVARSEHAANLRRRQLMEHLAMPVRARVQPLNDTEADHLDLQAASANLSEEREPITHLPALPSRKAALADTPQAEAED